MIHRNVDGGVIYPGTFDPMTLGHVDIIKRAVRIFGHITIGVAAACGGKGTLFTLEERCEIAKTELESAFVGLGIECSRGVVCNGFYSVVAFDGLLVDFARKNNIKIIVRGLRALSDFELEFKMAYINRKIGSDIDTVFIPASEDGHFIASSVAKEIVSLGGDVESMVSPYVAKMLRNKYGRE